MSSKTIVLDTVDNAYKMCSDYVCKKFKIEHESDLGYGKGYALINNEFQRVIKQTCLPALRADPDFALTGAGYRNPHRQAHPHCSNAAG